MNVELAAYVGVFALAAAVCLASLRHAGRVESADARRGFEWLLWTNAAWAAAQAAFLVVPGRELKVAAHLVGLVVGFATVGAWLYFCSAYSGRSLHRDPRYRRAAVAVFLAVVAVKVTNPVHHLYFSTTWASEPFRYLVVDHHALHWAATGLAYALAAVGYFMLFELFDQTSLDTRPLAGVAALTALPVAFNVAGYASPRLLDLSFEPVGVAAFAVGVLYVFAERFQAVRLTGDVDEPVVFVDDEGDVRDANERARSLFPALADAGGRPLDAVLPDVAAAMDDETAVLELDVDGETRYFLVTANPFTVGRTRVGHLVLFSDVTRSERHRRELERQNERLSQFASIVSHDLRNPLNVAEGRLELAREERDSDHLASVANALERMESLIEDVLALARQGETIGETEPVSLRSVAEESWSTVATPDATLSVADDLRFEADRDRTVQLFENLFRNAVEHGSTSPRSNAREDAVEHGSTSPRSNAREDAVEHAGADVAVEVGALDDRRGFYVADDGPGVPESDREAVFEPGHTTAADGTGFGLAIVKSIADAHGWRVRVADADGGGARFEVAGVTPAD